MMTTIKIAWRNLGRHKRRTLLAVLAIAVGQAALLAMNSTMHGYADAIRLAITGPMIGHLQVHHPEWREERAMDLVMYDIDKKIETIREDAAVLNAGARIYAPVLVAPKQDAFAAVVVGIDLDVESNDYGLLSGMQEKLKLQHVYVGHRLAKKIDVKPGDEIAVVGQGADGSLANDLYTVQEIIRSPADLINQVGIVMSLADAQQLVVMPKQAHEIVVRTKTAGQADALQARLARQEVLADTKVEVWQEIMPELTSMLKMVDVAGYFILFFVFVAAIAGIANTLMMSTFERMHEFGMLLALGTRPRRLVSMIVLEAVLLGLLGVIIGTLMGYGFVGIFRDSGIDFSALSSGGEVKDAAYKGLNFPMHVIPRLEVRDSMIGFFAVMVTSLLAAVWPAWIAGRLQPMEAMRK